MSSQKGLLQPRNLLIIFSLAINLYFLCELLRRHKESLYVIEVTASKVKPLENDTILLIWFWPFGDNFDLKSCSSNFNIVGCHLTGDRELYSKAHGVLINHGNIKNDMSNLPTKQRPFFQKWIWMHFESPRNTRRIDGLENLFNVTLNYRRDADIPLREHVVPKSEDTEDEIFPVLDKKDKLVCWIVSNWNEDFERVKYYNELKKHIDIYGAGGHFGKKLSYAEYKETLTRCKFYLSFENTANHYDYVTEKMFKPLTLGSVPVALGPPRYMYEKFVPEDAFIHVNDFSSPQKLAEHLLALDKNAEEYKKYFQWRKHFEVKLVNYPLEHACRACQYIRENKDYQVFRNLNKWYWAAINDGT
ncbi:4-galactosyl-N-acetylglucosaminide 3-alpha-L-fucosyltransferase 9-like [Pseudorasbora parva]|uniref:4-galactosyl-N-acetylglucosaminide 3-alpha-L-fucosyltransferase 9-like n=1 Tax=Pseudorasbora parva TaxID=51549 RepID=UPI00351F5196